MCKSQSVYFALVHLKWKLSWEKTPQVQKSSVPVRRPLSLSDRLKQSAAKLLKPWCWKVPVEFLVKKASLIRLSKI